MITEIAQFLLNFQNQKIKWKGNYQITLHKICENTGLHWPVFSRIRAKLRFCPYTGEYGSVETSILAYFMQCNDLPGDKRIDVFVEWYNE